MDKLEAAMTKRTLKELVDLLRGATRGLCSEDASKYIPRGVDAADCIEAADQLERLLRLVVAMDDHVSECCGCFSGADEEMLAEMNEARATLLDVDGIERRPK